MSFDEVPGPVEPAPAPLRSDDAPLRSGRAPKKTGSRRLNIILAVLLVVTLALTGYLIYLSRSWSQHSAELDAISSDLGNQVAQLQSELAVTQQDLEVSQEQLEKAQKRITELASEKALVGDDRESQRIIAQDTAQVANEALAVSGKLGDCISAQNTLSALVLTAQGDQNTLIRELAKENPDSATIAELNTAITRTGQEISEQQPKTTQTCSGAIDRYNALLTDLQN